MWCLATMFWMAVLVSPSAFGVVTDGGLQCPCTVAALVMYLDGGTIGGDIEDSNGRLVRFCLAAPQINRPGAAAPEYRRFYVGATHPDKAGAMPLDIGGSAEARLIGILREWLDPLMTVDAIDGTVAALPQDQPDAGEGLRHRSEQEWLALQLHLAIARREVR
ncbi:MAG: hypothetical protein R6X25_09960 [Candidatus Krumholzibacteriia bacterium]